MSNDHFDALPTVRRDGVRSALADAFGRALKPGAPETKHILGKMFLMSFLSSVIAQILVQPPGALASVPGWLRYSAVAAGFAGFMVIRRSTLAGVVCGELVMVAGKWWLG